MNKMKSVLCSLFALVAASVCVAQSAKSGALQCPVTQLTIPSKKAAVATSVYKGKTYYFCTSNCKRLFDKNPKKFVGK